VTWLTQSLFVRSLLALPDYTIHEGRFRDRIIPRRRHDNGCNANGPFEANDSPAHVSSVRDEPICGLNQVCTFKFFRYVRKSITTVDVRQGFHAILS
jgi:hypothetical protein